MISIGVDLSTSATGLVDLEGFADTKPVVRHESVIAFPDLHGIDRQRAIVEVIVRYVAAHEPGRLVIEGYSLNMKNASSVVPLVEVGGLLRFMLWNDGRKWLDPRAGEVKKFVTGKGTTPKSHMMMEVLHRWGHKSKDNNTADAYGCAAIGLAHANALAGVTLDQRKIAGALKTRSG